MGAYGVPVVTAVIFGILLILFALWNANRQPG
jgi:hypothetical protein